MYEYMRGLHQQFFKEPDFSELRQEINEIYQALTEGKAKPERRSLLKLVDLEAELRDIPGQLRRRFPSGLGHYQRTEHGAALLLRRGRRTPDGTAAEEG